MTSTPTPSLHQPPKRYRTVLIRRRELTAVNTALGHAHMTDRCQKRYRTALIRRRQLTDPCMTWPSSLIWTRAHVSVS
eukprot:CAMPEP_0114564608 /NCGR_PEP_ID=MMETSP0114-20121206/13827_1 /TAXON_ID=31324 /ORGANISM="Goniomonas sp, Strain m" /LENGTH=77 /DNA_ID=CAMNT_0001750719 /DNA_START=16 /DNA_END=246 /DNA_ORIENTATION=-